MKEQGQITSVPNEEITKLGRILIEIRVLESISRGEKDAVRLEELKGKIFALRTYIENYE